MAAFLCGWTVYVYGAAILGGRYGTKMSRLKLLYGAIVTLLVIAAMCILALIDIGLEKWKHRKRKV
jgi:hypothetical protein